MSTRRPVIDYLTLQTTQFKIMVQYQGSRREKILEGTKLGQMECAGALRPRDGLPEHFGI